ncbi:hypothetical protein BJ912DRAFT_906212 [Pholiota molesta]|nr:hypothetical protein BJ912DRAFT_906212 [Pholiota molesta]
MLFCPTCANLLVISAETGLNKWACNSCPYEFPITKQMTSRTKLKRKQIDDVLGGDEMWAHADQTQASCDKCNFNSAYFYQLQIRSADEPMTTCAYFLAISKKFIIDAYSIAYPQSLSVSNSPYYS